MKALVFKNVGNIAFQEVADPSLQEPSDVIVSLTASSICGTDLHAVRGTMSGMKSGTILGHEGIGIIKQKGEHVKTFAVGDRVIIPSTIGCGFCHYCTIELYSQCDNANPNGPTEGTAFYGGPQSTGPFHGLQAEQARVPYADANLIKIPENLSDKQVLLLSDILPTAYQAVEYIEPSKDDSVAVFGCGPVGQLVIACLKEQGIQQIFAIDRVKSRLQMAQAQGAKTINFDEIEPVAELRKLTKNRGPKKIIDAVGIDAEASRCCHLPFFKRLFKKTHFKEEIKEVAPHANPQGNLWQPGGAPSQVFQWGVQSIAKGGIFSIIGVYTELMRFFPIGEVMEKNLTIRAGNCNHRKYIPLLLPKVQDGTFDLASFITHEVPFKNVVEAYEHFDKKEDNWIKVLLRM